MAGKFYLLIEDNKLINRDNAQEIVDYLNGRIGGMTFYAANIQHLSDPTIQAGDVALAVDHKGKQYATLVTRSTFTAGEPQKTISAIESESQNTTKKSMAIRKAVAENNAIQNNIRNTTDWSQIWRDENGNDYVITIDITDSGVEYIATPLPTGISIDPTSAFRTEYMELEPFSTAGVVIHANYPDGTQEDVTSRCRFVPENGSLLYNRGSAKASITATINGKKYSTSYNYVVKGNPSILPDNSEDRWKSSSATRSGTAYQLIRRLYERHQNQVFDNFVQTYYLLDENRISDIIYDTKQTDIKVKLTIENGEYFINTFSVASSNVLSKTKVFYACVIFVETGRAMVYLFDKPAFAYRVLAPFYSHDSNIMLIESFWIGCSINGDKATQGSVTPVPTSYVFFSYDYRGNIAGYYEDENPSIYSYREPRVTQDVGASTVRFVNISGFDS